MINIKKSQNIWGNYLKI